jgi:hypothetical protein
MCRSKLIIVLLAFFSQYAWSIAAAEPSKYIVGDKTIVISGIHNLEDAQANKKILGAVSLLIPSSARLLTVFVEKENLRNQDLNFKRLIAVSTQTRTEQQILSLRDFEQTRASMREALSHLKTYSDRAMAQLSKNSSEMAEIINTKTLQFNLGEPTLLEIQRDDDVSFGQTVLMKVQAKADKKEGSWNNAICGNGLLLHGKLVFVTVRGEYNSDEDLQWVRSTCKKFVDRVIADN